jgi:hypothetical protein
MVHLIPDEGSVVSAPERVYDHNGQLVRDLEFVLRGEPHKLTVPFGLLNGDYEKERAH